MEFCPKCGAALVQKRKLDGCPRCNYVSKSHTKISTSEKINEKKQVPIIKKEVKEVMPIVNEVCKECGHEEAYFWTVQTRASDESETKFYKCVKCGHTRREYR